MKGIVLAGGAGTRLYPSTMVVSKQLLPIYDKPMIYHPISVLMLAGIRDILIISTPQDLPNFEKLLGTGEQFGVKFSYKVQPSPDGLAQAFILGKEFIGDDNVAMILGDNIFYGQGFSGALHRAIENISKHKQATVFAYEVHDPERFGVVEFNDKKQAISLEEKPKEPKSNYAVTGLYFYPNNVCKYAKTMKPSARGELEITDLNRLDTGTHKSLIQAGQYVQTIEENQGIKIACLEEIAYRKGFVTKEQLAKHIKPYKNNEYFNYVKRLISK